MTLNTLRPGNMVVHTRRFRPRATQTDGIGVVLQTDSRLSIRWVTPSAGDKWEVETYDCHVPSQLVRVEDPNTLLDSLKRGRELRALLGNRWPRIRTVQKSL